MFSGSGRARDRLPLQGIGEHHNRGLLELWLWARIAEVVFVDDLVCLACACALRKNVVQRARSVVLGNEVRNFPRKSDPLSRGATRSSHD